MLDTVVLQNFDGCAVLTQCCIEKDVRKSAPRRRNPGLIQLWFLFP